mmetsp:Transcript_28707/g.55811  ORF Transcript_28707/g.55811 Transcript_28707/m.55811 type:complete len:173 (+) Transcript_28707:2965-3483(+)
MDAIRKMRTTKKDVIYVLRSDVWSLGVTFWEVATKGRLPYDDFRRSKERKSHVRVFIARGEQTLQVPLSVERSSPFVAFLIRECLTFQPYLRPSARALLDILETKARTGTWSREWREHNRQEAAAAEYGEPISLHSIMEMHSHISDQPHSTARPSSASMPTSVGAPHGPRFS